MLGRDEDSNVIRITTGSIEPPSPLLAHSAPWQAIGETRRGKGLSVEQVAASARVSPLVVEAIETGAIERLPAGNGGRRETIAVCRALGLDPKPFLQDLSTRRPALAGQLDTPRTVGRRTRFLIIGLVWILLGAVLVAGRALGWMDSDGDAAPSTTIAVPSTTIPTSAPANPTVAFTVEVRATRGGTPVLATVNGAVAYDKILALDEEIRFEGDDVQLHIVQPTMVRVFVNGSPVAAETDMHFAPAPVEEVPAEEVPAEEVPAEEVPAESQTDVSRP